jgi:hypothetical protein
MRLSPFSLVLCTGAVLLASEASTAPTARAPETIAPNDNRQPAGQLSSGILTIRLDARMGTWYPEGPNGAGLEVAAFSEAGKALQNPGPLIRVVGGTSIQATIQNSLTKPLTVRGFGVKGRGDTCRVLPSQHSSP